MTPTPFPENVPTTMPAMLLTGHGGIDNLIYRQDVPTPSPAAGEVLVQVTATAKNYTDRKAREGLYPTQGRELPAEGQAQGRAGTCRHQARGVTDDRDTYRNNE